LCSRSAAAAVSWVHDRVFAQVEAEPVNVGTGWSRLMDHTNKKEWGMAHWWVRWVSDAEACMFSNPIAEALLLGNDVV
jgi:hypothetical protein